MIAGPAVELTRWAEAYKVKPGIGYERVEFPPGTRGRLIRGTRGRVLPSGMGRTYCWVLLPKGFVADAFEEIVSPARTEFFRILSPLEQLAEAAE